MFLYRFLHFGFQIDPLSEGNLAAKGDGSYLISAWPSNPGWQAGAAAWTARPPGPPRCISSPADGKMGSPHTQWGVTQNYGEKKIIHILTHLISKLLWVKDIKIVQNPSVLLTPSKSHMLISFFFHPLFFFMPAKIFERHLAAFQNFSIHVILLSSSIYLWLLVPLKTVTPTLIRSGKFACSVFMQKRRN